MQQRTTLPTGPVTHDQHAFLAGGERLWLASGEMHYFRIPSALWRDRLLKARQAGLNCIAVYVAWNFHEPREGEWLTGGDHDIARFLTIAADLGLYVILRPGPYICAEWDFGGLPAWLTTKPGIAYRTNNPAFMEAVTRYLRRLLPPLAGHQVSRGGNVLLIQNENEYYMSRLPGAGEYLRAINALIRESGFDIPIINCNRFSQTPAAGTLECINTWGSEIGDARRMRERQPDAPLLVTEFWCGEFDCWGIRRPGKPPREVARRALEILGSGAQVNYYMFHGGTNFAFWGSRMMGTEAFFQVTSYDYDAPLGEAGELGPKYYLTRLVNILATRMGAYFSAASPHGDPTSTAEGVTVLNLRGPGGGWCVLTNGGDEALTTARLTTEGGRALDIPLHPYGGAAIPLGLRIAPGCLLDYANVTPLGLFGDRTLVLHGPPGWEAVLSVNGRERRARIPDTAGPALLEHEGLEVLLTTSEQAGRCWECAGELILGPLRVGESIDDREDPPGSTHVHHLVPGSGELRSLPSRPAPRLTSPDAILTWSHAGDCVPEEWNAIGGPTDFDTLGNYYGYGWYRIDFHEESPRRRALYFPEMGDRLRLFHNGAPLGVWGRGLGAVRTPLPIRTIQGRNTLLVLADNMGRFSHGIHLMGERKGLFGHVYDAGGLPPGAPTIEHGHGCDPAMIPPEQHHRVFESASWPAMAGLPVHRVRYTLNFTEPVALHLTFRRIPNSALILFNGERLGFYPTYAPVFGEILIPASRVEPGDNILEFHLWGELSLPSLEEIRLHVLKEALTAGANWAWSPQPMAPTAATAAPLDGAPAWYRATFRRTRPGPYFLDFAGCGKGQLLLNGRNAGRYWDIGPQRTLHLPECWIAEENELLLLVEDGTPPPATRLLPGSLLSEEVAVAGETSAFLTV